MATSGQTLLTLPEEILSLFVGIYFSEVTITLWSHCAGGLQCRPGDVPYHPPRLPTTFNILLSCKTLHRVASSVMFECIKIRYADTTWMLYHEDLHCLPLHEFRHIRLSEFPFQLQHVLPWAWPRLKTLEILNVYQETHLNSELGASRRRPAWHPELAESVPLVCEVYNEILHICQSRNVDISIDLLIHRGCSKLQFSIDRTGQATLVHAQHVHKADLDEHCASFERALTCKIARPPWPDSEAPQSLSMQGDSPRLEWTVTSLLDVWKTSRKIAACTTE